MARFATLRIGTKRAFVKPPAYRWRLVHGHKMLRSVEEEPQLQARIGGSAVCRELYDRVVDRRKADEQRLLPHPGVLAKHAHALRDIADASLTPGCIASATHNIVMVISAECQVRFMIETLQLA